jgi:hypothetical protein
MSDRKLEPLRLGWIVGIVEGEGWLGASGGRPGQATITVQMTDLDVIERLAEWSGVGNVSGPYHVRHTDRQDTWKWSVTARDDAAWLIGQMAPYLGARRKAKALEVLDAWAAAGPTRGTADTCGEGHDIRDGSPNLRLVVEGKYTKRRCLLCQARRQREHRARKALLAAT